MFNSTDTAGPVEREWEVPDANFNDVGTAMVTLFQVATLSDWASVAHSAINSRGEGISPGYEESPVQIVYFLAFIIIGSFFSLNLFVRQPHCAHLSFLVIFLCHRFDLHAISNFNRDTLFPLQRNC